MKLADSRKLFCETHSVCVCVCMWCLLLRLSSLDENRYFTINDPIAKENFAKFSVFGPAYHKNLSQKYLPLKIVSAIFYRIFIFSPNDSPSKTIKNVSFLIEKALFALEIFKFLCSFLLFSARSRLKRSNGSGIIYVINWLV